VLTVVSTTFGWDVGDPVANVTGMVLDARGHTLGWLYSLSGAAMPILAAVATNTAHSSQSTNPQSHVVTGTDWSSFAYGSWTWLVVRMHHFSSHHFSLHLSVHSSESILESMSVGSTINECRFHNRFSAQWSVHESVDRVENRFKKRLDEIAILQFGYCPLQLRTALFVVCCNLELRYL
jgi:hypothetical protein